MSIDWNDNKKRQAFREALQSVYPSPSELEIFVDEGLNENISVIAGGENLKQQVYNLLKWARSEISRLDRVYEVFKNENPDHPVVNTLERKDLVTQSSNLSQIDWDELFQQFSAGDLADLKRAFGQGFEKALGVRFNQAASRYPDITNIAQIQDLLERYDADTKGPTLAVRFAECAIAQFQRTSEDENIERDLTPLVQWRDRIAKRFNVPPDVPAPAQDDAFHAYLLVALEVLAGSEVVVYPELHIAGQETPVPFGADKARCSIKQVTEPIAKWIQLAEDTLETSNYEFDQVVLELFLPCKYLAEDQDIATTWKIKNKRNKEISFGNHRRFVVRSVDRVHDREARRLLKQRWAALEASVKVDVADDIFHHQDCCPSEEGSLSAVLISNKVLGLKLVAQLPVDCEQRTNILYEIIDAGVPIALWISEMPDGDTRNLCDEIDKILDCHLTNFTDLAKRWYNCRDASPLAKSIRLLCDRPDRMPKLPDPDQDEDALSFAS